MAADKPQLDPGLLEQLYPDELGELDEAERRALRDAAALSAEEREELRDLNAMLGLIRAEDHSTPVSAKVRDSIMEAARAHHDTASGASTPTPTPSRTRATAQRAPRVPEADRPQDSKPFWTRIPMETGRQLALAGTVLFVAGLAFVLTRSEPAEQRFESANSAVSQEVSFGEAPGVAQTPAEEPAPIAEAPKADSLDEAPAPPAKGEAALAKEEAALGSGEAELAMKTEYDAEPKPEGLAAPRPRSRSSKSAPNRSARSKSRAPAKKKAKSKPMPKRKSASSAIDVFGDLDDSLEIADAEEVAAPPAPAYAGRGGQAKDAPATGDAKSEEKRADKTADTSQIDAIAESFASAHYDETRSRVDLLMADASVPARDKARGLEFKARAQEASGDPSGALDTYERLKNSYADFKPSAIAAAIARLERTLNSKSMKRRRMQESAPASMDSAQ